MNKLNEQEVQSRLKFLDGWSYGDNQIEKEFKLEDFKSALSFVNKIGEEAEEMNHHPDLFIHSYNKVKITISTHDAGGLTEKDFQLAEKIENHK